jgi:hypothetical protein
MSSAVAASSSVPLPVASPNELFLACHRPVVMDALKEHLVDDVATMITDLVTSKINPFEPKDWESEFDVQVEPFELDTKEFYDWWFAPDALDPYWDAPPENRPTPQLLNCDTHFRPIFSPETITVKMAPPAKRHRFATDITAECGFQALGRLVENPQTGHPSRFFAETEALKQNKNAKAGPSCYLVARKEMFARGMTEAQQRGYMQRLNDRTQAGYEVLPWALDLSKVAHVHKVATGERYLGDGTGLEGCWTASRAQDTARYGRNTYPVVVGYQETLVFDAVGGPGPSGGLSVDDGNSHDDNVRICVAGVRKFFGHRSLGT